tara:strand:+ start:2548 stop:3474 length:927 start_codon:yes stop_codon:yes gene_type:complete
MTGQSLELFYVDGRPDGIVMAEMFNWTGNVLLAPRTELSRMIESHEQARHSGIYLLIGEDTEGSPLAYIGQAEDIARRIKKHDVEKDWWTQIAIVTAAENRLNPAHIRYLEARLVQKAKEIGRIPLDNGNSPTLPGLSLADVSKMEEFLGFLLIVLPALRIDMFVERKRRAPDTRRAEASKSSAVDPALDAPLFTLENRKHGLNAKAVLDDGEFIVLKGSLSRMSWSKGSAGHSYSEMHEELCRAGVLAIEGDHRVFTESYAFKSPSAAAAIVHGRPANGTLDWHETESGLTYKEWEARRLATIDDLL